MIYIVGLGPGHEDYILPRAIKVLNESTEIIGFSRAMESLSFIEGKKTDIRSLKEIIDIINASKEEDVISIVASGDPTFYGVAEYIKKNYKGRLDVIPGISSFQYLTCKIGKSWSKAYVGSLHGREDDFIDKVNNNKVSIWLTDDKNNPTYLCEKLIENDIKCRVIVGEKLSYDDERIIDEIPENIVGSTFSNLSIFLVEKNKED